MDREDLHELHYITPISNISSIISLGILSYKHAKKIQHDSIAMQKIQNRRARKVVPGGRPLNEYVNLYICARNPMLYVRQAQHTNICVLRVNIDVLDLSGVVITDINASSDYVRFAPSPKGLAIVDKEITFAEYWTHNNLIEAYHRKSAKCAEVLVPDRVVPGFIIGAYVSGAKAKTAFKATGIGMPVTINAHLFFR